MFLFVFTTKQFLYILRLKATVLLKTWLKDELMYLKLLINMTIAPLINSAPDLVLCKFRNFYSPYSISAKLLSVILHLIGTVFEVIEAFLNDDDEDTDRVLLTYRQTMRLIRSLWLGYFAQYAGGLFKNYSKWIVYTCNMLNKLLFLKFFFYLFLQILTD